jgi:hypothetical protein
MDADLSMCAFKPNTQKSTDIVTGLPSTHDYDWWRLRSDGGFNGNEHSLGIDFFLHSILAIMQAQALDGNFSAKANLQPYSKTLRAIRYSPEPSIGHKITACTQARVYKNLTHHTLPCGGCAFSDFIPASYGTKTRSFRLSTSPVLPRLTQISEGHPVVGYLSKCTLTPVLTCPTPSGGLVPETVRFLGCRRNLYAQLTDSTSKTVHRAWLVALFIIISALTQLPGNADQDVAQLAEIVSHEIALYVLELAAQPVEDVELGLSMQYRRDLFDTAAMRCYSAQDGVHN